MTRCDQTRAWGALQGHYQAHGRDLDLREVREAISALSGLVMALRAAQERKGR